MRAMLSPSCPEETGAQGGLSDLPAGVQWWSWVGSLAGSPAAAPALSEDMGAVCVLTHPQGTGWGGGLRQGAAWLWTPSC